MNCGMSDAKVAKEILMLLKTKEMSVVDCVATCLLVADILCNALQLKMEIVIDGNKAYNVEETN